MNTTALPNTCHDALPSASLKQTAADFRVDEELGFDPAGDGEHLWVLIRKTGRNTRDVVDTIGKALSLPAREIGVSGLKDKHAVTTQWMSLPLAKLSNKEQLPELLQEQLQQVDGVECLRAVRGQKKLKTGTHKRNRFTIVLRDIATQEVVERQLALVAERGFPNYFGAQRFGREGRNLHQAQALFTGRHKVSRFKRGMYLSAARSYLFNLVLAERVTQQNWNTILPGEMCILNGSNSVFHCAVVDSETESRCAELDIHPSGPMFGTGDSRVSDTVAQLETQLLQTQSVFTDGLSAAGLRSERRALRATASDLNWQWLDPSTLELAFTLSRGVFATSLLAEIVTIQNTGPQPAEV